MANNDLARNKRLGQSLTVRLLRGRTISITNFKDFSKEVTRRGFRCVENNTGKWMPPGGRQIIWMKDRVIVRIKTRGNGKPPRKDVPHVSISYMKAPGATGWHDELAKFDYRHNLVFKVKYTVAQAEEKLKDPNFKFSWPSCIETKSCNQDMDDWANNCHFGFYNNHFDATGADKYVCGK